MLRLVTKLEQEPTKQKKRAYKKREKVAGMDFYPKLNQYKMSNVRYDVKAKEAYSWDWWCFVKPINGVLVFNDYRYSQSTGNHQFKVARLLEALGLEYVTVSTSDSLNDPLALEKAIMHLEIQNEALRERINAPRTRVAANNRRKAEIVENMAKINKLEKILNKGELA